MKYVYAVAALLNVMIVAIAAWNENWSKATFFAILTLCWVYMLDRDFPSKKTN